MVKLWYALKRQIYSIDTDKVRVALFLFSKRVVWMGPLNEWRVTYSLAIYFNLNLCYHRSSKIPCVPAKCFFLYGCTVYFYSILTWQNCMFFKLHWPECSLKFDEFSDSDGYYFITLRHIAPNNLITRTLEPAFFTPPYLLISGP